jgi:predicted dehydrogenase
MIRLCVVGCGSFTTEAYMPMIEQERRAGRVELVSVCDVLEQQARATMERFAAKRYETDYRQAVAQPDIDAVIIGTNIATHAPIALAALQAGKHVLVQKPIATSLEEANTLLAEAKRRRLVLEVEPPHVRNPLCRMARELIADGAIGQVCWVRAVSAHGGPHYRRWFWFRDQGGSVVYDMGVHAINWVLGLAGPARRVTALFTTTVPERLVVTDPAFRGTIPGISSLSRPEDAPPGAPVAPTRIDIEDNAMLLLELRNGALASVTTNYCTLAHELPSYEVYGTEGTIYIGGPQGALQYFSKRAAPFGKGGWVTVSHQGGLTANPLRFGGRGATGPLAMPSTVTHLVDCILQGKRPVNDGEVARHALEIMLKAAQAAATGQAQDLVTTFTLRD